MQGIRGVQGTRYITRCKVYKAQGIQGTRIKVQAPRCRKSIRVSKHLEQVTKQDAVPKLYCRERRNDAGARIG